MASWAQIAVGGLHLAEQLLAVDTTHKWGPYRGEAEEPDHADNDEAVEEAEAAVDDEVTLEPSAEELADVTLALQKVWELGAKLDPGRDYALDVQGYANRKGDDYAKRPLFRYVADDVLFGKSTFAKLIALLDNYEREVGKAEHRTKAEKAEESAFIDDIAKTPCLRYLKAYLVSKGKTTSYAFKRLLGSLWFRTYASQRGGPEDSCGFEHVFVGEERGGDARQVTGLHNWVQLYLEEKKGALDYHGYVAYDHRRPAQDQRAMSLQFTWKDADDGSDDLKPTSTSLIGTSPELEIALYTLAAFSKSGDDLSLDLDDGLTVRLKCILWDLHGAPVIRTCYPESI
eukprot:CAMPEP_0118915232 /NCGR_PEP_ID=MMETSP1166-20130328/15436_1 /TAXON_ID=1104430 /ORGANISM="Chrysoreinhardia sp, Strain CCMP3193" /LENGTH=342 /DNA_ID=CAMNT_0006854895 /DNA_START=69 /DNA_END=1097 /DNA_ORIENTATION=+